MENIDVFELSKNHPIIFFDGTCHLCDRSVQFVLKRDHKKLFRFCALQSDLAIKSIKNLPGATQPDSIVFLSNGEFYYYSDAALQILKHLNIPYPWLAKILYVFPRSIRDAVYKFIAKKRYQWFGRYDTCLIPEPGWADRFLDV